MDAFPTQPRKRRSTTAMREELEPQKRPLHESAAEGTSNHNETQIFSKTELWPGQPIDRNIPHQGSYIKFGKILDSAEPQQPRKVEGLAQKWVQRDARMRRRLYCCVCKEKNASGRHCNVCGHERCPECLIRDVLERDQKQVWQYSTWHQFVKCIPYVAPSLHHMMWMAERYQHLAIS